MLANGLIPIGPLTSLADVVDATGMLVATGRAIAPQKWVDVMITRARQERESGLPHNFI